MNRPITAFVAHIIAPTPNSKREAWYGVYFESTRWQHGSTADAVYSGYSDCKCHITVATIDCILDQVPHGFSLIIETDDSSAAKQLNDALLTRKRGQDVRSENDKRGDSWRHGFNCDEWLTPVLNRIDVRTVRGESFLEIIDSSRDASAAKGLAAAHALAQRRMEKDRGEEDAAP